MSQFLTVLLLATALMLALCFGVAAWRLSDGEAFDINGRSMAVAGIASSLSAHATPGSRR